MSEGDINTRSQRRRLSIVLGLNLVLIVALVAIGFVSNSVGVFATAGDTLGDLVGLILGLVAVAVRDKYPDDPRAKRSIAIVALINAALLTAVTIGVAVEAIIRLGDGAPAVLGLPMAIISLITLVVMSTSALVLGLGAGREDIHMKSVLLDAIADAAAAAGVLIAGVIIWLTNGLYWLDPLIALALAAVIGFVAVRLGRQAINALHGGEVDFED